MIVHEPELLQIDGRIVVSAWVAVESGRTFPQRLWFSLPERDAAFVEDRGDGFAAAKPEIDVEFRWVRHADLPLFAGIAAPRTIAEFGRRLEQGFE